MTFLDEARDATDAFEPSRPTSSPERSPRGAAARDARPAVVDDERERVRRWYDGKTEQILAKYGPGPRVHFHTGLVEAGELAALTADDVDPSEIQRTLRRSQERALAAAAERWNASGALSGRVLDVGCGLGGGSLYWAQEHGAHVTAVSDVPRHIAMATELARSAGVGDRVAFTLADAHAPPAGPFDAAVAIESSVYFDREAWFRATGASLVRGGRIFIADTFSDDPALVPPFDAYWLCHVAPLRSYARAAEAAGFACTSVVDASEDAVRFWRLSAHWIERRLPSVAEDEAARLVRSLAWHQRLAGAYASGSAQNLYVAFERTDFGAARR